MCVLLNSAKVRASRPFPETVDGRNIASGYMRLLGGPWDATIQPPVTPHIQCWDDGFARGGLTWKIFCQSTLKCGGRGEVGAGPRQRMWVFVCRAHVLPTGNISSIHRRREVKTFVTCRMFVPAFSWTCRDISKPFCCSLEFKSCACSWSH